MSSQYKVNRYALNDVIFPSKKYYSVILGLNPSKGARSPSLWNKAYDYFNIDSEMIPIDIDEDNFSALLNVLKDDDSFVGGAIAAPHKETAAALIENDITDEAKIIGSINCLFRNKEGHLCGTNTDGEGSLLAFKNNFKDINLLDFEILIMGAGGTGKAVSAYFVKELRNPKKLTISSRSNAAKELSFKLDSAFIEWEEIEKNLHRFDLIINCTSVGSNLDVENSPISESAFLNVKDSTVIYDVIYDPKKSKLLKMADERNLRYLNGLSMNLEQAVIGFNYSASRGDLNLPNEMIRRVME